MQSSNNINDHDNNELLESKLRQLAMLNDGISINPRSPRQVSQLLYNNNMSNNHHHSFSGNMGMKNGVALGPTDKATLQKIILHEISAHAPFNDDESRKEGERQRQIAKLVLQCRELLSSTDNNNDRSSSSHNDGRDGMQSFAERASRGVHHTSKQQQGSRMKKQQQQVANYTNDAQQQQQRLISNQDGSLVVDSATTNVDDIPSTATKANLSPYEQMVMNLFTTTSTNNNNIDNNNAVDNMLEENEEIIMKPDPYWIEPLLQLTKSTSRTLVRQLQPNDCPMGYNPLANPLSSLISSTNITTAASSTATSAVKRTTSLLSYIRQQKHSYFKDAIMLVRVGDFYETYGIDAILLVEHCGLNPMANKCRAGCPWRNVQSTLDGLTNVGYRVAVYEEWNGVGDMPGSENDVSSDDGEETNKSRKSGSSSKLKTRYLAQVVSSANPTYMHGLVLDDDGSAASDDVPSSSQYSNGDLSTLSSPGRSYVGVIETNAGYTVVEVSAEERTVVVSERLTAEAVSCRLVAYPPADPLFYVPPYSEDVGGGGQKRRLDRLPFLPWRQQSSPTSLPFATQRYSSRGGVGMMGKVRVKTLPPALVVSPRKGLTDVERAKQTIVSAFLRLEDDHSVSTPSNDEDVNGLSSSTAPPLRKQERRVVTHDDFVIVSSSPSSSSDVEEASAAVTTTITKTNPLHLETATQLGLMSDPAIPPLISSLLPDSAPSSSRRFLRRWLLVPPPPDIADAMSILVRTLKDENDKALPSMNAPPLTGKVISLIRAGQASAAVYREILSALDAASEVLLLDGDRDKSHDYETTSGIVNPLMNILRHDTGTEVSNSMALRTRFLDAMKIIESVVSTQNLEHSLQNSSYNDDDQSALDYISYYGDVVPPAFFERNEAIWRGRVKPSALKDAHTVQLAAKRLAESIAIDFWGVSEGVKYNDDGIIDLSEAMENKNVVVQDIFNNILALKAIPSWAETKDGTSELDGEFEQERTKSRYFNPRDRNGKLLRNRYTTQAVQEALSDYVEACNDARAEVERVLTKLSWDLVDLGHLTDILQASHLNLILSTAAHHASNSNVRGWNIATIINDNDKQDSAGHFEGLWPYWMDRSESVANSFDLDGLFLLTAPNMSGKSTLMRSTAAAALMTNAGLCAPLLFGSSVKRFDSLFVRGASADVPTEDKSAFGAEMGDVASLLRSCGAQSLVFVDEIGRGTSPKDGTSLAGAILEKMSESYMSGMFATHLHGILELPYSPEAEARLKKKRMAIIDDEDSNGPKWTYKIEDGVCTNR